jgi:hypothetical protein
LGIGVLHLLSPHISNLFLLLFLFVHFLFDNFISLQQDYLLGFSIEAAAQIFAILSNTSIVEFFMMISLNEFEFDDDNDFN